MRAIFSDDYSLENYRTLLQSLLDFYAPFEAALFESFPKHFETLLDHRRKAHLLRADLSSMGDIASSAQAEVPSLGTFEERMGAMYVVEGATLGGAIIRKHLQGHFGGSVSSALSFYSGYGKQAAAEWRSFGKLLESLFARADEQARSKVVAGANATFAAMEDWLAQPQTAAG